MVAVTAEPDDRAAISRLLARYATALDARDGAVFADCFVAGTFTAEQIDAIMRFHARYAHTAHYVLDHDYTIEGPTAVGHQRALVTFVRDRGGALTAFDMHVRYVDERLVKVDGAWKFTKREPVILFSTEETSARNGPPPGFWDADDAHETEE